MEKDEGLSANQGCLDLVTPPIGTPGAGSRGGNSTPTVAPVAGVLKSPVISPVSGK